MILIIASLKDYASVNIMKQILRKYPFSITVEKFQGNPIYTHETGGKAVKLVTVNEEPVYAQNLTDFFPSAELVIFVSRHSSASGTPTLSVHTPGNLGKADLGGISRLVSVSPANAMRIALKTMMTLVQELRLNYQVSYECTHHGPSLNVPTMFVELGSSPRQWEDVEAAEVVAHATMETVSNFGWCQAVTALGVGGPHYNEKFTRIALENEVAFGHIIPKYAVPIIDDEILGQCVARTLERVEFAVLDWKGLKGEDKRKVVSIIEKIDLEFRKV